MDREPARKIDKGRRAWYTIGRIPPEKALQQERNTQMNTDWNGPEGEFDTAEKQGELLMLLSSRQVTVHTGEEPDFDYMEPEDLALVVENPRGGEDLLIELCAEFSVFFETWHGSYKATEAEYQRMVKEITAILEGRAAVMSLCAGGNWLAGVLCPEAPAGDADADALLERPEVLPGMAETLRRQGGRIRLVHWDPARDRVVEVTPQN